MAFVHFIVYLSYADLVPNNLFLYKLIHYFKIWMPYLAVSAVVGLVHMVQPRRSIFANSLAFFGIMAALALSCLDFNIVEKPVKVSAIGNMMIIDPVQGAEITLDFIDLPGVKTVSADKYLTGNNELLADDRRLSLYHDMRPIASATGTRIIFTTPLAFKRLIIKFDKSFQVPLPHEADAVGSEYAFALNRPYWLR
jgi:hypothetical protein